MNFHYLIVYLSILAWSIIPFKQVGKKHFYFFYTSSLVDPLTMYLRLLFHSGSNIFFIPLSFLSLVSLYEKQIIKKNNIYIILIFIFLCLLTLEIDTYACFIILSGIYFLILIKFVSDFIISIYKESLFNIFSVVLVLDSVTEVIKFLGIYSGFVNGYFYFYAFAIFQIIIGIFFLIFKEDNLKLIIRLSKVS